MNNKNIPTFDNALKLATKCHKGIKRWNGDDYITHPIAVADKLTGNAKIVAILHDVVEDTDMTIDKLRLLGYPDDILTALSLVTHKPTMNYRDYILNIISSNNKTAILVKIKDLDHNLSDLNKGSRRDKYDLALHFLKMRY